MIGNTFQLFELDKITEAVELLVKMDSRDRTAEHILQLLIDIKRSGETLAAVLRPQQNAGIADQAMPASKKETSDDLSTPR